MAKITSYYDQHDDDPLACSACGWSGTNGDGGREMHRDLLDISCPRCDQMLLIVNYPTVDETRAAASRGDDRAIQSLEAFERE